MRKRKKVQGKLGKRETKVKFCYLERVFFPMFGLGRT